MTTPYPLPRRNSPATLSGYHAGRAPRNKGQRYPADPPRVEEIIEVMRAAGVGLRGARLRGLVVVLWRAGLRIHEGLLLTEHDLDPRRGSIVVRRGKGGQRREIGMDDWGWEHVTPWLELRQSLPYGPLFCVIEGSRAGGSVADRRSPSRAPQRRRARSRPSALCAAPIAPHTRDRTRPEGVPINIIQCQLGHSDLGVTSVYLHGIDAAEIIDTVHRRRPPMIPATIGFAGRV